MFLYISSVHELFFGFLGILLLVFFATIAVLMYGFYRYKRLINSQKWIKIIEQKISNAIIYGNEAEEAKEFDDCIKNELFRELFLEKLVDSERKFSGTAAIEIRKLFEKYGLEKEAGKKLEQKKAHLIVGGIQELTEMNVEHAFDKIVPFLSHPSHQVYQEAQYSVVHFKGFEGLGFLGDTAHKISEWQQLRLLRSVSYIPEMAEQAVSIWLKSENNSVVIFTLRLLRKFQMLSLYTLVKDLTEHPSLEIRKHAVRTMQSLENPSMVTDLLQLYPYQPMEVQEEIIKVMKMAKDQYCISFFKDQLLNHPLSNIKIIAAESLLLLGFQDYLTEIAHGPSSSEQLVQVIKHTLQEKIC